MKARFKTLLLSALGAMTAFSAVTYTSCNNDKCKAIVCAYGGVCNDGSCVCPSGYEGTQCEVKTQDKFVGVWNVFEKGTLSSSAQYTVSVEPGVGKTDVVIKRFHNYFKNNVQATVKGDTLYIPQQTIENYIVEGKGFLVPDKYYNNHGKLQLIYYVKGTATGSRADDFGWPITGDPALDGTASLWNK